MMPVALPPIDETLSSVTPPAPMVVTVMLTAVPPVGRDRVARAGDVDRAAAGDVEAGAGGGDDVEAADVERAEPMLPEKLTAVVAPVETVRPPWKSTARSTSR